MQVEEACARVLQLRQECPQALQANLAGCLADLHSLVSTTEADSKQEAQLTEVSLGEGIKLLATLPPEMQGTLNSTIARLPSLR